MEDSPGQGFFLLPSYSFLLLLAFFPSTGGYPKYNGRTDFSVRPLFCINFRRERRPRRSVGCGAQAPYPNPYRTAAFGGRNAGDGVPYGCLRSTRRGDPCGRPCPRPRGEVGCRKGSPYATTEKQGTQKHPLFLYSSTRKGHWDWAARMISRICV